jgi:hypothetical protein
MTPAAGWNRPVSTGAAAVAIDTPIAPSLAPMMSRIIAPGRWPSRPVLTSLENIAPDDATTRTPLRSRPGLVSSSCSIGRANGSPTTVIALTCSAAAVSHSSAASNFRPGR